VLARPHFFPVHPEPVEGSALMNQGFDELSPNGNGAARSRDETKWNRGIVASRALDSAALHRGYAGYGFGKFSRAIVTAGLFVVTFGTANSRCRVHLQAAIGDLGAAHHDQPSVMFCSDRMTVGLTACTGPQFSFAKITTFNTDPVFSTEAILLGSVQASSRLQPPISLNSVPSAPV
jgi:hypothetical protein